MARPLTVTIFGSVALDTVTKKISTASVYFPGSSTGDTVEIDTAGITGIGDYTVEFWMRPTNVPYDLTSVGDDGCQPIRIFSTFPTTDPDEFSFSQTETYVNFNRGDMVAVGVANNTWVHVALVNRADPSIPGIGNREDFYLDGVLQNTGPAFSFDDIEGITILSPEGLFQGHIDELRISKTARYTSGFTPPTTRFVDDSNTLLLMHFDSDIEDNFDENPQGSANLALTQGLGLTASFATVVRPDGVTWDETDTWDTWYKSINNWDAAQVLNIESNLSVLDALITQQAEARLDIVTDCQATAINYQLAQATLNLATLQLVDGRDLDRASAELPITAGTNVEADMFRGGEATLNLATLTVVDGRDLDIASAELPITVDANIIAGVQRNAQIQTPIELNQTASGGRILDGGLITTNPETWDTVPGDTWEGFTNDYWGENYGLLPMELQAEAGFILGAEAQLNVATVTVFAGESVAPITAEASLSVSMAQESFAGIIQPAQAELPITLTQEIDVLNIKGGSAQASINLGSETLSRRFLGGTNVSNIEIGIEAQAEDFDNAASLLLSEVGLTASPGIILESAEASLNLATLKLTEAERIIGVEAELPITINGEASPTLIPAINPFELPIQTDLNADAVLTLDGRTTLNLASINITDANRFRGGTADLSIEMAVDARSSITIDNGARLNLATLSITDGESRAPVRASAELPVVLDTVFSGDLRLLDSDFVFGIYAESRTATAKSETRIYKPYSETRVVTVDS